MLCVHLCMSVCAFLECTSVHQIGRIVCNEHHLCNAQAGHAACNYVRSCACVLCEPNMPTHKPYYVVIISNNKHKSMHRLP